ncbi:hypothetical protein Hanom_Chr06g00560111 [Helianthus anomalus]
MVAVVAAEYCRMYASESRLGNDITKSYIASFALEYSAVESTAVVVNSDGFQKHRKSTEVNNRFRSMFQFGQQCLSLVLYGSDLRVTARSVHMVKRMVSSQHECGSGRLGRTESTRLTRSTSFSFSTRRLGKSS